MVLGIYCQLACKRIILPILALKCSDYTCPRCIREFPFSYILAGLDTFILKHHQSDGQKEVTQFNLSVRVLRISTFLSWAKVCIGQEKKKLVPTKIRKDKDDHVSIQDV